MSNSKLAKDLLEAVKQDSGTKPYDTAAEVLRVENDIIWVHIDGGAAETPCQRTIDAKPGDVVKVRVADGIAWITGNQTAPPTDDEVANAAKASAAKAFNYAEEAHVAAEDAKNTADSVHAIAEQAQEDADAAKASAENASEYAARALGNLSTVQSVTETLNWIASHGTMTLTSDVALDPTHVYFVADPAGDYSVGGNTYSVVTEPDVADIGTYYELSIDESLNNYVGTHLALDTEGLWLLPATSGTYKVLIATGAGSTYTTAGMYIIGNTGEVIAKYKDHIILGVDDGSQSYMHLDYHSMQMIGKEGDTYLYVRDLRNENGVYSLIDSRSKNQLQISYDYELQKWRVLATLTFVPKTIGVVRLVSNGSFTDITNYTAQGTSVTFYLDSEPSTDDKIQVTYTTEDPNAKTFTFGSRMANHKTGGALSFVSGYTCIADGRFSHAEGSTTTASGQSSHAEGTGTTASGQSAHAEGKNAEASGWYSHAEGQSTTASGDTSHAQNAGTIAGYSSQTAIGEYNDNQSTNAFEIGNGGSDNARSNAFEIGWDGNARMALDTTAASGTDHDLYAAINALGWASDVIV